MTRLPAGFLTRPLAHRGYHNASFGCIENSRAAFQAAMDAGYGIELDLQLSSDGQAVVFHDYGLTRLTGAPGTVQTHSLAELQEITLIDSAETIPSLQEVLALVAGRAPLLIELKDQDGAMGPAVGRLEEATASLLAGYRGPVAVMSFNPHSVAALARLAPDLPRGLTTEAYTDVAAGLIPEARRNALREIPDYDRVGASFISHQVSDLARPRVAELKGAGADILCWTVRSPAEERVAREMAQNITFEGYPAQIPDG